MVLIVLGVWMTARDRGEAPQSGRIDDPEASAGTTPAALPAAIESFVTYVAERDVERDAGPDHAYTADGIRRLAEALSEMATRVLPGAASLEVRVAELRDHADRLQADRHSLRHADIVRAAFTSAAAITAELQRTRFPHLTAAVDDVRNAAGAIVPDQPLLGQSDAVQRFFERSSDVLRAMSAQEG